MAKSKTETIETIETQDNSMNDSTALAQTDEQVLAELRARYARFSGEEYNDASDLKFGRASFLNKIPPNYGIFIKEASLQASKWTAPLPELTEIVYSSKNSEKGLLLNSEKGQIRMQVVYRTPRYVEIKNLATKTQTQEQGWKPLADMLVSMGLVKPTPELYAMKQYDIISVYMDENGYNQIGSDIHNILREYNASTISVFYFVYFLDENNCRMHELPISLPARGMANVIFATKFDEFVDELDKIRCQITGDSPAMKKSALFKALCVFSPKIECLQQGGDLQSPVATVTDYVHPTLRDFPKFFLDEMENKVVQEQGFLAEHAKTIFQEEGFHAMLPGAEDYTALPAAPVDAETGEDIF